MAKANFNGEYKCTKILGTISGDRNVELGHYADGKTEYGEKIYITGKYTTRNGEEKQFINATKLTLSDLAELQAIDLTGLDTTTKESEMFD